MRLLRPPALTLVSIKVGDGLGSEWFPIQRHHKRFQNDKEAPRAEACGLSGAGHAVGEDRQLEQSQPDQFPMFPPFLGCSGSGANHGQLLRRHQERKLQALSFWRDGLERQLAALNAAISTLERQMQGSSSDT
jgi:hypothetical protein